MSQFTRATFTPKDTQFMQIQHSQSINQSFYKQSFKPTVIWYTAESIFCIFSEDAANM